MKNGYFDPESFGNAEGALLFPSNHPPKRWVEKQEATKSELTTQRRQRARKIARELAGNFEHQFIF